MTDRAGAPRSDYIPSLDGWRAIAISLVVVSHGLWYTSRPAEKLGALGVNLFFAISGYLICTLLLRERERTGTISLRSFYLRRIFRILPPALLYVAVIGICAAAGWLVASKQELATALYAANYFVYRGWYTAHFWSLSVEEHFYLIWPAVLLWCGPRRTVLGGLAVAAICVAVRPWIALHVDGAFRYQRTEMRIDAFLLPCIFAILLQRSEWVERGRRWLTGRNVVLMLAVILAGSYLAEKWAPFNTLNKFLQAALLPLIVLSPVLRESSILAKILNWSFLRWLGRISYGVYIWQEVFLADTSSTPARLLLLPWAVLATLACAWASYRYLERPLRKIGHDLARRAEYQSGVPSSIESAKL